ncbi:hypothetical protein [Kribbella sp. CA-294648]|uniref:hypothetical protein n=1 Tax=Kribbella sp. CA-294648 TaxID=3239948 RepID=UPI003D902B3D
MLVRTNEGAAMQGRLNQVGATVTIVGSILFLVAAFLPISYRVFPQPSAGKKLESINAARTEWLVAQVLFGLGAVVTVIGIGLYAYYARRAPFAGLIWSSVALLTVGVVPWLWQVYARAADPEWFAQDSFPMWPYLFYFLVTEVGLAVLGVALLSAPVPTWVGLVVIGSMVVLVVLTLIFRDMVPLAFYIVTLLAGVMFFRQ